MVGSFVATATSDEEPNAAARQSGIGMRSRKQTRWGFALAHACGDE